LSSQNVMAADQDLAIITLHMGVYIFTDAVYMYSRRDFESETILWTHFYLTEY